MKGRAVLFMGARKPFEITEYEVPDPEPGDIVLKITQAGVCGSDLHSWRGDGNPAPVPPGGRTTGHEGTGVVYKLGKGVTTDAAGQADQRRRPHRLLRDPALHALLTSASTAATTGVLNFSARARRRARSLTSPAPTRTTTTSGPTSRCSRSRTSCRTPCSASSTAPWAR